jgi:hypothetical protein
MFMGAMLAILGRKIFFHTFSGQFQQRCPSASIGEIQVSVRVDEEWHKISDYRLQILDYILQI